ncbi:hypothetical protein [Stigmatella erecta]|uniref:Uncharacterized protein n=1 Tax=Stigmatella erecta TaxID=83460 RepID=A0A1I0LBJ0_9BACT|nr:hypothetical protein [Stigmatella erecta]SEU36907.1 hypothetical protein SAMN05443639_1238 [Stigmatella erecta]
MALAPVESTRWAVLRALEKACARIAHGHPSIACALKPERLTERAWVDLDRTVDDVRWEPGPAPFLQVPPYRRGESFHLTELRELLQAARRNAFLAWEDPGGLTRAQAVAVLACALERVRAAPAKSPGPLFDIPNPNRRTP